MTYSVRDVPNNKSQRAALWAVVKQYTGHPKLVDWAARFLKAWQVPPRNPRAFARALQLYSQRYIDYHRERPERFASPLRTLSWGMGDCDDKTIFIATVLRSFRIPVRAKFIRFRARQRDGTEKQVSHVFPEVQLNGEWVAMESVHPWELGDSPETRARRKTDSIHVETIGP